jgi:predicted Fe-Mo cluster-binding NifX family protein
MMKIVIPVADKTGEVLSEHFGRAPYFNSFTIEEGKVVENKITANDSEHFGGTGQPPERIEALGAKIVITTGMGMKAIQMFQDKGIAVLEAVSLKPLDNVNAYLRSELKELTRGCLHSHN